MLVIDQLISIAWAISDRMEEMQEFDDIFCSDRTINFGCNGIQYILSIRFSHQDGYGAILDDYKVEVKFSAIEVGRMLRGDFSDLMPLM